MIRRNPSTGRWVIYVRTATRLHWPTRSHARTAVETPVYEIMGNADTQARAIQALAA